MEKRTVGSAKSAVCDDLGSLLEGQLKVCDEIITLSRHEQQVLMDRQSSALPEIVAAKERCAEDLRDLQEASRETLTAWEAGIEPDKNASLSLSQLLPRLPLEDQLRIEKLQESLWSRIRTLRMLNRAITLLIKSSLTQADAWLSLLTDMTDPNAAYDASGQVKIGSIGGSQLLDQHA